jgi:hypothetical protein
VKSALRVAALVAAPLAAGASVIELAPSDAVACLTTTSGKAEAPVYPPEHLKAGRTSTFRATFTFDSPTRAPKVDFPDSQGEQAFRESVRAYAALLRVPCMAAGSPPVTLSRDIVFQLDDDRVAMTPVRDEADAARKSMLSCIRHQSGERIPPFPPLALREGRQGRVHAEYRFVDANSPPIVTAVARPYAWAFKDALERWSQGLRMPCHAGEPLNMTAVYAWTIEGEARYGFREMDLRAWVGSARQLRERGLQMDLTKMGCPFAVSLTYLRPDRSNPVREIGTPDPRREPFLEWLRESELALRPELLDAAYADTVRIDVPCYRFNIPPQEKK